VSTRIDRETGLQDFPGAEPPEISDTAFGLGSLWLVNRAANAIIEIDPPTSLKFDEVPVGAVPSAIAVGRGVLWVTNFNDDTITRITVAEGGVRTTRAFPVGDGPVDVAVGEGGVWVASRLDRTVSRLDPATGKVVATIALGNEPQRLAAGGGAVWVTVRAPE
jgi:YVTN family beta-propeller protein